jgi:hypothetical protein
MEHTVPAEVIKLLIDACPEAVKEKDDAGSWLESTTMVAEHKSPRLFEVVRHPSQHRCASFLNQGLALEVVEFAAWVGKRLSAHFTVI